MSTTNALALMIREIVNNFESKLSHLNWMDLQTTNKALGKLRKLKFIIGQPHELLNTVLIDEYYGSLDINHDRFLESMLSVNKFKQRIQLSALRKSANESVWLDFADTAVSNAFYSGDKNTVCKRDNRMISAN